MLSDSRHNQNQPTERKKYSSTTLVISLLTNYENIPLVLGNADDEQYVYSFTSHPQLYELLRERVSDRVTR